MCDIHGLHRNWDSSVVCRCATGWMVRGSSPGRGLGIFLFTTESRPALWPTQPPIQWVPEVLSLGVKQQGREADHLVPRSKCVELYLHSSKTPSWRGAQF
jgi:hypothetical protein